MINSRDDFLEMSVLIDSFSIIIYLPMTTLYKINYMNSYLCDKFQNTSVLITVEKCPLKLYTTDLFLFAPGGFQ